eukprot:CAMPEP_0201896756 /NCGR_PEP_ID=MMETSP0902-20130614/45278_1 /ASSEMBLY_ACC=CAM_ASM_000551 /TAXON_ID=420261 /ORGANISM="Thalassiosira antarctica, Strain CCMP982" /LENGTH=181 /DNA_ID=CAMNT_0048429425 /DNA_START=213 /DNA_END=758 /DNA_ORIENTATION=-
MSPLTSNPPVSKPDESLVVSVSWSDFTHLTSPSSDSDSTSDESSSMSLQTSQQQCPKKSVRFSNVHTRVYNVVEELAPPGNDEDEAVRRSLGWDYIENEIDLKTHMNEIRKEREINFFQREELRKESLTKSIQDHIHRVEQEKDKQPIKKKGFKSKVLKPLWKGFLDAASRSALVMPTPYG